MTALVATCCSSDDEPVQVDVPISLAGDSPVAHGDHMPKYGGFVYMHGDLHFEVLLTAEGAHRLYLSDAVRTELPASVARDVLMTVHRPDAEPEVVELEIDGFGESWLGESGPIEDESTMVLLSFSFEGEPYEIELPFVLEPPDPDAPDPHESMNMKPPGKE